MANNNEHLKNRFMERYTKVKAAESFIEDSIKIINTINSESDCKKVVDDFLSTAPKYEVDDEDLNVVKQILHEFVSNEITQNETLAYLNYIYDVKLFKAEHLWLIQDIFKCYF